MGFILFILLISVVMFVFVVGPILAKDRGAVRRGFLFLVGWLITALLFLFLITKGLLMQPISNFSFDDQLLFLGALGIGSFFLFGFGAETEESSHSRLSKTKKKDIVSEFYTGILLTLPSLSMLIWENWGTTGVGRLWLFVSLIMFSAGLWRILLLFGERKTK